jgi:hypothetical protein
MKKRTSKLYIVVAFLLCLLTFFLLISDVGARTARADTSDTTSAMDTSDVLDDLSRSTINGKAFSLSDYGKTSDKDTQVLTFVEYCYNYYANAQDNYALYVYIYNPHPTTYNLTSNQNKIQFSVAGGDYQKYAISFLSASTKSGYENVFLKYKVVLTSNRKDNILSALDADERVYSVSGVELLVADERTPEEYKVATTYRYTGYAKDCGKNLNNDSTLAVTSQELETVSLEVKGTYFRYPTTTTTATQLNSVYFAVDNSLLQKYGNLYKIWAEYYQYNLAPIVVVSDDDVYNCFKNAPSDIDDNGLDYAIMAGTEKVDAPLNTIIQTTFYYDWIYGKTTTVSFLGTKFEANDGAEVYTKKPLIFNGGDTPRTYTISRDSLMASMYQLAEETGAKTGELNDYVLCGGKGYQNINLSADDLFDLQGFNVGNSFWNWWYKQFGYNNETIEDITPIYKVTQSDLYSSDITNDLLIATEDETNFITYCKEAMNNNKSVYLFRYGTSDYKELEGLVTETGVASGFNQFHAQSIRWQTVDMNFDIIQLGFGNAEKIVIIPVVSNPIINLAGSQGMATIAKEVSNSPSCIDQAKKTVTYVLVAFAVVILLIVVIKIIRLFSTINTSRKVNKIYKNQKKKKD